MNSLNIALAVMQPPLPFGNAAARWYYVLARELRKRGHRLKIFSPCQDEEEKNKILEQFPSKDYEIQIFYPDKTGWLFRKLKTFARPFSYTFSNKMQEALRKEGHKKSCDIVHIEQLWTSWLATAFPEKSLINIHHLQAIDLEDALNESLTQRFEKYIILSTEKKLIRKFRHFRSVSPRLISYIQKFHTDANTSFVPCGIDPDLYPYVKVPRNAFLNFDGHNWECERGYRRVEERCEPFRIPWYAVYDSTWHDWECKRGERRVGDKCESIKIPSNAVLNFDGHDWECGRGYRRNGGRCTELKLP